MRAVNGARVTMLALLLALTAQGAEGQPCDGGIYRPFTLPRQVKLATAYFVNPELPDTARIRYAYSLKDVMVTAGNNYSAYTVADWIASGHKQLAVEVRNDVAGALTPVRLAPSAGGNSEISPCRLLSSVAPGQTVPVIRAENPGSGEAPPRSGQSRQDLASTLEAWVDGEGDRLRLLSDDAVPGLADTAGRVVTWDPTEGIAIAEGGARHR